MVPLFALTRIFLNDIFMVNLLYLYKAPVCLFLERRDFSVYGQNIINLIYGLKKAFIKMPFFNTRKSCG